MCSSDLSRTSGLVGVASGDDDDASMEKGAWISGFIAQGKDRGDNGYKSNSQGGTIGFDVDVKDNVTLGLAYSKVFAKIKPTDKEMSSSNINVDALSFYAQIEMDKFISESVLSVSRSKGKLKSTGYNAETSMSYIGKLSDNLVLMPFASIGYMHNNYKAYQDNGADISSSSSAFFNKKIGVKILAPMNFESVKVVPSLKASVSHASNLKRAKDQKINIHYQGKDYSENMNDKSSVSYNLGAGVLVKRNNIELQATYDCTLKSKYSNHQGALKLRVNL